MATYGSDDEQVEALKRWWQDNGNSLITGVLLVLAVFFGMRQWQAWQVADNAAASDLYQQISDLALARMTDSVTEEELFAAQAVYNQLKNDHTKSIYTRYAALAMARFQVDHEQLDLAAAELQWIVDNPGNSFRRKVPDELLLTARLRLARVKLAQGEAQQALDLLAAADARTMPSGYAEVEGDALVALGRRDDARAAYERALATNETGNPAILQLKLQDLGVSAVEAP